VAPSDETFWRDQESRRADLEQPCCTQSSMAWSLVDMPGDLAIVIHGESDCLTSFFRHLGRNTHGYYGTRLSERQLIAGDTSAPLRRLLTLIASERRPAAILVLGTCPIELVGDPFEMVVEEVARDTGVPMRALRTHGLALMSQARCHDWLCCELASLAEPEEPQAERINLIGLPRATDRDELVELLGAAGLVLNGCYPNGTTWSEWRRIRRAAASFVVDRSMFPRLCGALAGWGQQVHEVPLPVGCRSTAEFYRAIAESCGAGAELEGALAERLDELNVAGERLAGRARGRRLAVCVRMVKTHRSDRLAYDGLGELPMLRELGFELGILVQGPPEEAARQRFGERLAELGHGDVPFDVFEGPWMLGDRLRRGRYELAVMSDVAQNVVEQEGVRMIGTGELQPLLAGVPRNLRLIEQVLEEGP
jgi:nitrogenase molybdenum-iron protein alpha/beta subunit